MIVIYESIAFLDCPYVVASISTGMAGIFHNSSLHDHTEPALPLLDSGLQISSALIPRCRGQIGLIVMPGIVEFLRLGWPPAGRKDQGFE